MLTQNLLMEKFIQEKVLKVHWAYHVYHSLCLPFLDRLMSNDIVDVGLADSPIPTMSTRINCLLNHLVFIKQNSEITMSTTLHFTLPW